MISSKLFILKVSEYFSYLVTEFDMEFGEAKIFDSIFFDIHFTDDRKVISISYENVEDYLQVIVYLLKNGVLPDYDDQKRTLHLNQLNSLIFPLIDKEEIGYNNEKFSKFSAAGIFEKDLLKKAKDLRLCLKHFPKVMFE